MRSTSLRGPFGPGLGAAGCGAPPSSVTVITGRSGSLSSGSRSLGSSPGALSGRAASASATMPASEARTAVYEVPSGAVAKPTTSGCSAS